MHIHATPQHNWKSCFHDGHGSLDMCSSTAELGITCSPFQFEWSCLYCHLFTGLCCIQPSVGAMSSVAVIPCWPGVEKSRGVCWDAGWPGWQHWSWGYKLQISVVRLLVSPWWVESRLTSIDHWRDIICGNKNRWGSCYIFSLWQSRSESTRNKWEEWVSDSQLSWIRTLTTAARIT